MTEQDDVNVGTRKMMNHHARDKDLTELLA